MICAAATAGKKSSATSREGLMTFEYYFLGDREGFCSGWL